MVLEYKGHIFNHGDYIEGRIYGRPVSGHINILEDGIRGRYYFCQDEEAGSYCTDMLGHKNSWVFTILPNGDTSDHVELFVPNNSQKEIKFSEDKFNRAFVKTTLTQTEFSYKYHDRLALKFKYKPYHQGSDDCYIISNMGFFNKLDTLKEDIQNRVISDLSRYISHLNSSNLMVQVTGNQQDLLGFLEGELSFYRCNVYRSKYSGEIINCLTKNL